MSAPNYTTEVLNSIRSIKATEWNALNGEQSPFLRHEFLLALENNNAVGQRYGWLPRFITARDDNGKLAGAMPLYEKDNSYGELVFDWSWADAYHRHGMAYYPKLVSAIPYTPATGNRLLALNNNADVKHLLIERACRLCEEENYSSLHCLFPVREELELMQRQKMMVRTDVQYHWHNHNYETFADFLAGLKNSKRKKIRQERNKVLNHGVSFSVRHGDELTADEWVDVHRFYAATFEQKSGYATLDLGFWQEVGQTMGKSVVIVMAHLENKPIACAINFRSNDVLYGRHWGCDPHYAWDVSGLHFETCYYQGIEYAITHRLQRYEPGAQGEYKIARGFLPSFTHSAHWIRQPEFSDAIARFLQQEKAAVEHYKQSLDASSPYRTDT